MSVEAGGGVGDGSALGNYGFVNSIDGKYSLPFSRESRRSCVDSAGRFYEMEVILGDVYDMLNGLVVSLNEPVVVN